MDLTAVQPLTVNMNETIKQIVQSLKSDLRRDVYEADTLDGYWITYRGGGPFPKTIISQMVGAGILVRKYEGCECYCLSKSVSP